MFRRRSRAAGSAPDPGRELSRREIAALGLGDRRLISEHASSEPSSGITVVPSLGLIQQLLDEFGLRHSVDSDGDLVVRWEKCSIYFFFYGDEQQVVQARLYLNRRFDVDDRAALIVMLDEWNRTRLLGKAYTILPDDGRVAVCAEQAHDFEGATRAQIKYAVAVWIDVLLRLGDWIDEQI